MVIKEFINNLKNGKWLKYLEIKTNRRYGWKKYLKVWFPLLEIEGEMFNIGFLIGTNLIHSRQINKLIWSKIRNQLENEP